MRRQNIERRSCQDVLLLVFYLFKYQLALSGPGLATFVNKLGAHDV